MIADELDVEFLALGALGFGLWNCFPQLLHIYILWPPRFNFSSGFVFILLIWDCKYVGGGDPILKETSTDRCYSKQISLWTECIHGTKC